MPIIGYKNEKIKIGGMYLLDEEFLNAFFKEAIRKKKNEQRRWLLPSLLVENTAHYDFLGPNKTKFFTANWKETKGGVCIVLKKNICSKKLVIYKVMFNGETRFLSENQLRYAKEIVR